MELEAALEGLLFLCGDEGIKKEEILAILKIDVKKLDELITILSEKYKGRDRGLVLKKYGSIFKLVTKSELHSYYIALENLNKNKPLTSACLEVLAIIAYNEPITRIAIEEIRGVSCSHLLRKLQALEMIVIDGHSTLPGRPLLYKTTVNFLDVFDIKSLDDLPQVSVDLKNNNENDLYKTKYKENN